MRSNISRIKQDFYTFLDEIAIYRIWNVARSDMIHFGDELIKENESKLICPLKKKYGSLLL